MYINIIKYEMRLHEESQEKWPENCFSRWIKWLEVERRRRIVSKLSEVLEKKMNKLEE